MRIAVIALGKIGLPLAVQFAWKGHEVVGVDVDAALVDSVNAGREPFPGEADLQERLTAVVSSGRLKATTDYADAVPGADAVVVVVPLVVDEQTFEPDFRWMDSATRSLAANLTAGTLVSYETTLPVGTTRERWKPLIESVSGLQEGTDFHLVFSPERVMSGRVFADLRKYPKLVGGVSTAGGKRGAAFYESVLDFDERQDLPQENGVWDLGSAEAAEFAKLAETTYRDVNIALANQFAQFAASRGIDLHQVIAASNSQPYSHIHRPGIAVGGHCIPVYPRLYLFNDPSATVVRAAREANAEMPAYAVSLLATAMGGSLDGARVAVLGASYRGGVKETAFSGVFGVVEALRDAGATALVHDPLFDRTELERLGFEVYTAGEPTDAVIVQADHREYATWGTDQAPGAAVLLDGRNITSPDRWAGVTRIVIGRG